MGSDSPEAASLMSEDVSRSTPMLWRRLACGGGGSEGILTREAALPAVTRNAGRLPMRVIGCGVDISTMDGKGSGRCAYL